MKLVLSKIERLTLGCAALVTAFGAAAVSGHLHGHGQHVPTGLDAALLATPPVMGVYAAATERLDLGLLSFILPDRWPIFSGITRAITYAIPEAVGYAVGYGLSKI